MTEAKSKRKLTTFQIDVNLQQKAQERGYNITALLNRLLKEYLDQLDNKHSFIRNESGRIVVDIPDNEPYIERRISTNQIKKQ